MSDVAVARSLLLEVWPTRRGRPAKICIAMIFEELKRIERGLSKAEIQQRPKQWTERRVRSIWEGDARRIDNYEMVDLEHAALEAAGHEYRESIDRSKRLATFISALEADQVRAVAQRRGASVGNVGSARVA